MCRYLQTQNSNLHSRYCTKILVKYILWKCLHTIHHSYNFKLSYTLLITLYLNFCSYQNCIKLQLELKLSKNNKQEWQQNGGPKGFLYEIIYNPNCQLKTIYVKYFSTIHYKNIQSTHKIIYAFKFPINLYIFICIMYIFYICNIIWTHYFIQPINMRAHYSSMFIYEICMTRVCKSFFWIKGIIHLPSPKCNKFSYKYSLLYQRTKENFPFFPPNSMRSSRCLSPRHKWIEFLDVN